MKEQLLSTEKKIVTISLIIILILFSCLFVYRYSITSKPSYQAAIKAISNSDEVLADVRTIESFGFLPTINTVPNKDMTAEYVIKVFGEKDSEYGITNRRIQIVVEKGTDEIWETTYLNVSILGQSNDGNDIVFLAYLSSGALAILFFIALSFAFLKRRKLLLDPQTLITTGIITDVTSRIERTTMPGQSNHGVVSSDWENRSVEIKQKMFQPAVAFKAQNGEIIQIEPNFLSSKEYKKGEKVQLIYNVKTPNDALLQDAFWFWVQFFGTFFITLGGIALGSGILILTL